MPIKPPDSSAQPDATKEVLNVLQGCHDLELVAAQIYQRFAEAHKADPEIAALWRKTAAEEDSHAQQIAFAMRVRKDLVVGTKADRIKVFEILAYARAVLIEVTAKPLSIVDALKRAIELETRFQTFHLDEVAVFADEGQRQLFRAMQAADRAHVTALQKALARYEGR